MVPLIVSIVLSLLVGLIAGVCIGGRVLMEWCAESKEYTSKILLGIMRIRAEKYPNA